MNDAAIPHNSSFSAYVPELQIALDSTSIGAQKTCPTYYRLSIGDGTLPGYAPRDESIHLRFGIEYHAALEFYDRRRAEGLDHDTATNATVRSALIRTWDFALGRPWASDMPNKNRETLIRTIVWYLEQFKDDPLETVILKDGKPAVEIPFRFDTEIVSALSGERYALCGHLDRLVRYQNRIWIVDRKTTKYALDENYFLRYSPDNQMSLYTLAGGLVYGEPVAGVIVDAAQVGVTFARFRRQPIDRTPSQLEEWFHDLQYWLKINEGFVRSKHWPMNDKSCNSYISQINPYGCPYRPICGMTPELRQQHLNALYTKRVWDPLQSREV